jgi:hypothetical protein
VQENNGATIFTLSQTFVEKSNGSTALEARFDPLLTLAQVKDLIRCSMTADSATAIVDLENFIGVAVRRIHGDDGGLAHDQPRPPWRQYERASVGCAIASNVHQ